MSIVAWVLLGLFAGFIASKLVNNRGAGPLLDIGLGIAGAMVGGVLFTWAGAAGVTGLNLWSLFVAVLGAMAVLGIYHAFAWRRVS